MYMAVSTEMPKPTATKEFTPSSAMILLAIADLKAGVF
jgi:hypothetical protein